jgi:hypothetical protein
MRLSHALPLVALPFALACGGLPLDKDGARNMFHSMEGRLQGNANAQPLSIDFSFESDCPRGGTVEFDGELDTEDKLFDGSATFQYDVHFEGCADSENKLDGDVQYMALLDTELMEGSASFDYMYVYRGSLVSEGEATGSCDFDVRGAVSVDSTFGDGSFGSDVEVVYEGQLCGHDADDVLNERYESHIRAGGTVDISDV